MEIRQEILEQSFLFQGIEEADRRAVLSCVDGKVKTYGKQEILVEEGEKLNHVGLVLEGCVQVISQDAWGNRSILEQVGEGGLYGAAFACAGLKKSPVSVVAPVKTSVLQLDVEKVLQVCPASCPFHQQMIRNLVYMLAGKNVALNEKIQHLSCRSTREKLLAYLTDEAKRAGKREVTIPFDRQGLADYLCVERSAMCAELGKLKREGVLDYRKNRFRLL